MLAEYGSGWRPHYEAASDQLSEERLASEAESLGHAADLSLRNGCSSAWAALQPGRRGSMNARPLRDHRMLQHEAGQDRADIVLAAPGSTASNTLQTDNYIFALLPCSHIANLTISIGRRDTGDGTVISNPMLCTLPVGSRVQPAQRGSGV